MEKCYKLRENQVREFVRVPLFALKAIRLVVCFFRLNSSLMHQLNNLNKPGGSEVIFCLDIRLIYVFKKLVSDTSKISHICVYSNTSLSNGYKTIRRASITFSRTWIFISLTRRSEIISKWHQNWSSRYYSWVAYVRRSVHSGTRLHTNIQVSSSSRFGYDLSDCFLSQIILGSVMTETRVSPFR